MENEKNKEPLKLSRRSFLKATLGAGGALMLSSIELGTAANAEDFEITDSIDDGKVRSHVDSADRELAVPIKVKSVVPSGRLAQIMLCSLCPEKLAAVSKFDQNEVEAYRRGGMEFVAQLPETGELYSGSERNLNTKSVESVAADIVLDIGDYKSDLELSLDYLQANADTTTIFIDGSFGQLPQAYRTLGKLMGCEGRAELLASYIENLHEDIEKRREEIESKSLILYAGNDLGLRGDNAIQNAAIEFLGGTAAKSDREMDIGALDPDIDFVVFNDYNSVLSILNGEGEAYKIWSSVPAIQRGRFARSAGLYHNWFGSPALFPQTIGLMWLGHLIWPNVYDYDMAEKVKEFYDLFFNYSLSDEEIGKLLVDERLYESLMNSVYSSEGSDLEIESATSAQLTRE